MFDKLKDQFSKIGDLLGAEEEYNKKKIQNLEKELANAKSGDKASKLENELADQKKKNFQNTQEFIDAQNQNTEELTKSFKSANTFSRSLSSEIDALQTADVSLDIKKQSSEIGRSLTSLQDSIPFQLESLGKATTPERAIELGQEKSRIKEQAQSFAFQASEDLKKTISLFESSISDLKNTIPPEVQKSIDPTSQTFGKGLTRELLEEKGLGEATTTQSGQKLAGVSAAQALSDIAKEITVQIEFEEGIAKKLKSEMDSLTSSVDNLNVSVEKTDAKFKQAFDTASKGAKNVANEIKNALDFEIFGTKASTIAFGLFLKNLKTVTDQTTELSKQLGSTVGFAEDLRDSLTTLGTSGGFSTLISTNEELLISQRNVLDAVLQLNKGLGTSVMVQQDLIKDQIALTRGFGLQVEDATELAKIAITNRKTTKDVTKEVLQQTTTLARQKGILLDVRSVLTEVAKTSGDIRAQLGFSSENLAEAVVNARGLGTTLSQTAKQASGLLDFEKSIRSELEAEILLGRGLNLERARSAALQGDLATVSKELAAQMGSVAEFGALNVIQQQSLATALGLSTAELADQVEEYAILNQLGAENLAQLEKEGRLNELLLIQGGERLYNQQLQQSQAQRLEETLRRIEGVLIDLAEGPLGVLAAGLASMANNALVLGTVLSVLTAGAVLVGLSSLVTAATALAAALGTSAIAVGVITGGLALVGAGIGAAVLYGASESDDDELGGSTPSSMVSGLQGMVQDGFAPASKGPFTVTDSYGQMAVTTEGDDLFVGPNAKPLTIQSEDKTLSLTERVFNQFKDKIVSGDGGDETLSDISSNNIFESISPRLQEGVKSLSSGITNVDNKSVVSPSISNVSNKKVNNGGPVINTSYNVAQANMESKYDEVIKTNKELLMAIKENTKVSTDNATFIAKSKSKLVVGATDFGTQINVNSYRIQ